MKSTLSKLLILSLLLIGSPAAAQDDAVTDEAQGPAEATSPDADKDTNEAADEALPVDPSAPKLLSGMSILGNEEAPKSLVIIPWKSSEIGADLGLADGLDDSARPVDKEVFLRELAFYKIRSGE